MYVQFPLRYSYEPIDYKARRKHMTLRAKQKVLVFKSIKHMIIANNYEAHTNTLQEVGHPSSIGLRPNPYQRKPRVQQQVHDISMKCDDDPYHQFFFYPYILVFKISIYSDKSIKLKKNLQPHSLPPASFQHTNGDPRFVELSIYTSRSVIRRLALLVVGCCYLCPKI